jgi:two-component system, cell cycle sensor histidine kinase and response regulator CckA
MQCAVETDDSRIDLPTRIPGNDPWPRRGGARARQAQGRWCSNMKSGTLEAIQIPKTLTPLRALIVEHSHQDIDSMLVELRESGYLVEYTLVETREAFRAALSGNNFDAVLAAYRLPNWSGLDALVELRRTGKDIPFLLVSGTLGEEAAVECIKQGASDYIRKDHLSRLPAALKRAMTEKRLRDENALGHEALRVSEARNRDLVEHAVYGISRVSADGEFLDANPALLRILGCSHANRLKTLNFARDLFRFPEQHARLMAMCRQNGQIHGAEAEWRRADGGIVMVRLHARRLCTADRFDEFEVTAEDVTELRAMERQLRQAQKFEAVGQLAGGVAHDFNNVVGAILGWAELGFDQCRNNPAIADRFSRIREQAERAAALTRELLTFARQQVLQPRAVDLNTVASGLHGLLDKVIGKHIEVKFLNAPVDPVKADPAQIEQVLMNLCINARDAMPEGGRLVMETEMVELDEAYCHFYPYVTAGRYAVMSVADTGIGMDVETRERIFEPFFTTKERGKGTGMGLATVYGIVKQHAGFIHVYSEPAHGSLFRVYLPVMEGGVARGAVRKAPTLSMAEMRGSETVLIAEDHESVREMARQTLVGMGYRVLSAGDGEEALRLCELEQPALAILDVIMPKLGGPGAATKLFKRFSQIRVLFTSGYSAESEEIPDGAKRRYLQKPYSPTTLARLVRQILDEPPAAAYGPTPDPA